MQPQAVVFDLFETLITEFAYGKRKVDRANRDYEQLIGLPTEVFRKEWSARQECRMTGEFPDYLMVLNDVANNHQLAVPSDVMKSLYQERIEEKLVPFRDIEASILAMLRELKQAGLKLALISNATEEEVRGWSASALAPFFDEVLFSYEVKLAKPDKRIYELACARLGIEPQEAVFVGDGGSNEIQGALESGMTAYQCAWFVDEKYRKPSTLSPLLETPEQLLRALEIAQ